MLQNLLNALHKSLPAREEWIEIAKSAEAITAPTSLPAREEWIEILSGKMNL